MEQIKLSDYVDLILFLQNQTRIRKSQTNHDLFLYVTDLIDKVDLVGENESLEFLRGGLEEYITKYSFKNESYPSTTVSHSDQKMVNDVLFEFLTFFEKTTQDKFLYLPNYELEIDFNQKLLNLLSKGVGAFKDLDFNFTINLDYAKQTFSFGLFNPAAIHLSIAVETYNAFLYSELVEKTNYESKPSWFEMIKELDDQKSRFHISGSLIRSLHEIRQNIRNATLHENKHFEEDDTKKLIDNCFESILMMYEVLIKNGVSTILDEYIDTEKI